MSMSEDSYNQTVTTPGLTGPCVTTKGAMYQSWLAHQSPSTWGTLTFDEWTRMGATQEYWGDWVRRNRPSKPKINQTKEG